MEAGVVVGRGIVDGSVLVVPRSNGGDLGLGGSNDGRRSVTLAAVLYTQQSAALATVGRVGRSAGRGRLGGVDLLRVYHTPALGGEVLGEVLVEEIALPSIGSGVVSAVELCLVAASSAMAVIDVAFGRLITDVPLATRALHGGLLGVANVAFPW